MPSVTIICQRCDRHTAYDTAQPLPEQCPACKEFADGEALWRMANEHDLWAQLTENDRRFLKGIRVSPD